MRRTISTEIKILVQVLQVEPLKLVAFLRDYNFKYTDVTDAACEFCPVIFFLIEITPDLFSLVFGFPTCHPVLPSRNQSSFSLQGLVKSTLSLKALGI